METGNQNVAGKTIDTPPTPLRSGIRFAVGLVLLGLLLFIIEPEDILRAFREANPVAIAAAVGLLFFNLGFQILKWRIILQLNNQPVSWTDTVGSFFFGLVLGILTPAQVGEFGGRAFRLPDLDPGQVVGFTILDKLQTMGIMALAGLWSLAFLFQLESPGWVLLNSGLSLMILFVLVRPVIVGTLLQKAGLDRFRHRWIGRIHGAILLMTSTPKIAQTLSLTVLFYGVVFLQCHLLLNAFSPVDAADSLPGYAAMMFVKSILPLSLGDLGTREAGLVYFLSLRNVPQATAFSASILLFVINLILPAVAGLLFLPKSFAFRKRQ